MDWALVLQEWKLLPSVLFEILSSPGVLVSLFIGGMAGMVFGMLPGISAVMSMSLLIGLVFNQPVEIGLGLLISIYVGAMASGGVTAILLNIPGTPAAAATGLDGYPLAKQGRAKEAIEASFTSSFVGGILGALMTLLLLPFIAVVALKLGDWEIFLVALIGLSLAGALSGDSPLKGWVSALLGVIAAMVGMEEIFGHERFGYTPELIRGFEFVPALIGLFGLSEVLLVLRKKKPDQIVGKSGFVGVNFRMIVTYMRTLIRSTLVAVGIGIIPGVGESASCWASYDLARRTSKEKDKFGKGCLDGVIAAETANSATAGGALIPALVFGIPGSGPTAILIAALIIYGFRPGPLLMIDQPGLVAKVVVLFWVAAVATRLGAMVLSPFFIRILSSPREIILPVAASLGVVGAWASGFTAFDIYSMFGFGVLGYVLRRNGFPLAPMVLGILVGGIADTHLRRALQTFSGDLGTMFGGWYSMALLALFAFTVLSQCRAFFTKRRGQ